MKKIFALVITFALTLCTLGALTSCGGAKFDENKNISVVTREDGSGTKSACMEIIGLKGKTDVSGVIVGKKSHSKRIGGTGLGLAIVKHICAIYGADLSIDSTFGEGTTFTVVFKKQA